MNQTPLHRIIENLHQFIGLIIGPFILIAAITGMLYAIAGLIEGPSYRKLLFVENTQNLQMRSYAEQVKAADQTIIGEDVKFLSFRPAPNDRSSTRVLYLDKSLRDSEYRTVFLNPYDLTILGTTSTYGTTGVMPIRMTIDFLHRDLLLNKFGRIYSELAASWLWIGALTGFYLFYKKRFKINLGKTHFNKNLKLHTLLGLVLLLPMIFLSITGLTWSELAGAKISTIRKELNWQTPSVDRNITNLERSSINSPNEYYELFDKVADVSKNNNITSSFLEIRPGRTQLEAWTVSEYQRSFPTKVDTLAINPYNLEVISEARFKDFNLMAKFTRWGIDLHMGVMFGAINQIVLILITLGISVVVITGIRSRLFKVNSKDKLINEFIKYIDAYFLLSKNQARLLALAVVVVSYVIPWVLYSLAIKFLIEAIIYYIIKKKA